MSQGAPNEPSAQIAPVLLTTEEAAQYLNVPSTWLGDAARHHRIRCIKLGRHVRFRIEHLDELIAAGEQGIDATPAETTRLMLTAQRPRGAGRSRL